MTKSQPEYIHNSTKWGANPPTLLGKETTHLLAKQRMYEEDMYALGDNQESSIRGRRIE